MKIKSMTFLATAIFLAGLLALSSTPAKAQTYSAEKVGGVTESKRQWYKYPTGNGPGPTGALPPGIGQASGAPYGKNTADHEIIVSVQTFDDHCGSMQLYSTSSKYVGEAVVSHWGSSNNNSGGSVSAIIAPGESWRVGNCGFNGSLELMIYQ